MVVFIIGRVLLIEFMVARSDDVYLLVFENVKSVVSFGVGGVIKAVAFYSVTSIYDEKVTTVIVGSLAEVMGKGDVITPVGGILGSVLICQIRDQDDEDYGLTPAGGRHAIHVYLLWPRSLVDPKEAFAREPPLVQEQKVGQLGQPAAALQKARGCRISLLSRVNEISFNVVAVQQPNGHSGVCQGRHARCASHAAEAWTFYTFRQSRTWKHFPSSNTTLQFTITTQCLHDRLRHRDVMLALVAPTPELRAHLRAHHAVQSLPDPHQVHNAAAHLAHAVPPTRAVAVVPIMHVAHLEVATVVLALQCPEAQK
jgi:hypothetical protein